MNELFEAGSGNKAESGSRPSGKLRDHRSGAPSGEAGLKEAGHGDHDVEPELR